MISKTIQLLSLHRFRIYLTLVLSMGFSVFLVASRFAVYGQWYYMFLIWNLFLALVPFSISTWLYYNHRRVKKKTVWLMSATWLLFIPNAPYILTDLFHLSYQGLAPKWFDLIMILSFAWNGLILAMLSWLDMFEIIKKRWGYWQSWLIISTSIAMSSFGIYIGRFLRWNSWDILLSPQGLISDIAARVLYPYDHPRTWGMTILLTVFLLLVFFTVKQILNYHSRPDGSRS